MTKHRLETLTRLFYAFYRANMEAQELVGLVGREVGARPKRARRDNLWSFDKLAMKTRLSVATEYVLHREELEKNKPALYNAFYVDHNHPGSNFYDSQHGEWNLISSATGHFKWEAVPINRGRSSVHFSTDDLTDFYPALLRLAMGLKTAFLLSDKDSLPRGFRTVIVGKGESRFRKCGPNYEAPRIPSGTALLFHGEQEENGRVVIWSEGNIDRFGLTVWGRFFAVQIDSGFRPSQTISVT